MNWQQCLFKGLFCQKETDSNLKTTQSDSVNDKVREYAKYNYKLYTKINVVGDLKTWEGKYHLVCYTKTEAEQMQS